LAFLLPFGYGTISEAKMSFTEQIRNVLTAKAEALVKQDARVLTEILDDSFVYVNSSGNRSKKQQYIGLCCTSGKMKFLSQSFENIEVQDFGPFAVATLIVHDEFDYSGKSHSGVFRSLCVFKKYGQKWLWAAGQTMSAENS
jgi:hypothetical protein